MALPQNIVLTQNIADYLAPIHGPWLLQQLARPPPTHPLLGADPPRNSGEQAHLPNIADSEVLNEVSQIVFLASE
jgi:hypothetical protein